MERLQRILAARGVASRRAAEELIREGRVKVNGVTVTELGTKADPVRAVIHVDGKLIRSQRPRYILLNKPSGYITTVKDERDRRTVMELVTIPERVYPVGRLDRDTEGLLLLTNDGDVANRVMHPRYELDKEYHVLTVARPSDQTLQRLRDGVVVEGKRVVPKEVRILRETNEGLVLTVTVHEGIFHLVRRMMDSVGIEVERLRRVRVGPLSVAGIPLGTWRELSEGELRSLLEALHLDETDEELGIDARTSRVRAARRPGDRLERGGSNPYARRDQNQPPRQERTRDERPERGEREEWAPPHGQRPSDERSRREEQPRYAAGERPPRRGDRSGYPAGRDDRFERRDRDGVRERDERGRERRDSPDRLTPRDQRSARDERPRADERDERPRGGGRGRRYYDAPRNDRRPDRDERPRGRDDGERERRPPRDHEPRRDRQGPPRSWRDRDDDRGPGRRRDDDPRPYPFSRDRQSQAGGERRQERDRDDRPPRGRDDAERPPARDRDRRSGSGRQDDRRAGPGRSRRRDLP